MIKIDFADGVLQNREELDRFLVEFLDAEERRFGVACRASSISGRLRELIQNVRQKYHRRVAILVDEYDKPILDNIDSPDVAAQMREGLKNFYSVFKGQDANIQFIFMAGVSKFSKVSLFSGLNQLKDITVSETFSTICGYTHKDLCEHFADHLQGVDWEKVRLWYNGYKWLGGCSGL